MDSKRRVNSDPRRALPSVDRLVREVRESGTDFSDWILRSTAQSVLDTVRRELSAGSPASPPASGGVELPALCQRVRQQAQRLAAPHPRRVINATGVVLHTNLGRAPLAPAAQTAVAEAMAGYSNLELDLESGRRGSRMGSLEAKIVELSGAEAAHVVNNNAAAVLLALNTLSLGRSAIVSRGELVEIGGSFRVPSIMERAGVTLKEVGTTNRTHLVDYENAIDDDTGLLLKIHRSNFEQRGFVAEADVAALAQLARAREIPFVEDLGSGTLVDLASTGLPSEAFAPGRLALGVDVVCFSGDKLLGGPQAGILMGRREMIDAMRRNPLARALRVDKLTVAALGATLDAMLEPARVDEIPVVADLRAREVDLEPRAKQLCADIAGRLREGYSAEIERSEAAVGGGSLPEHRLPGWAVVIEGPRIQALADALRAADTPVLARVRDDRLWLDVRTLRDNEFPLVSAAFASALPAN